MVKACSCCKVVKQQCDMYKQGSCKECGRKRRAIWRRNNKEKEQLIERKQTLRKYGLTIEQYNNLFSNQIGCCAGCNRHQSVFSRSLSVDHDHKTGKIRGLLCNDCNLALGKVQDSKLTLQNLLNYLNTHTPELADNNTNVVEIKFPKKVG